MIITYDMLCFIGDNMGWRVDSEGLILTELIYLNMFLTHLKLCIAIAIHNFKWVKKALHHVQCKSY